MVFSATMDVSGFLQPGTTRGRAADAGGVLVLLPAAEAATLLPACCVEGLRSRRLRLPEEDEVPLLSGCPRPGGA
jgi:hypothetical protein